MDDQLHIKLIDFGSASVVDPSKPFLDKFQVRMMARMQSPHLPKLNECKQGTIQYSPPEVLRGEKYRGKPADIWALGILLYTILCGETPFNTSEQARKYAFKTPRVPLSVEALQLLHLLLQKSPCQRPSIDQIMTMSWLQKWENAANDVSV